MLFGWPTGKGVVILGQLMSQGVFLNIITFISSCLIRYPLLDLIGIYGAEIKYCLFKKLCLDLVQHGVIVCQHHW